MTTDGKRGDAPHDRNVIAFDYTGFLLLDHADPFDGDDDEDLLLRNDAATLSSPPDDAIQRGGRCDLEHAPIATVGTKEPTQIGGALTLSVVIAGGLSSPGRDVFAGGRFESFSRIRGGGGREFG